MTAAALIMSIAFAALIAAQVSFMRIFGLGLTLAVLVDATLVRMALLPAFMRVMGKRNWWAPRPLVRLHERFGLREGPLSVEIERVADRDAQISFLVGQQETDLAAEGSHRNGDDVVQAHH